ncbi:Por secretion system C-terminal sorting domain-containing protein [Candidatus Termititenax persephonae]|uniref:Por secretion system C-terminal sorting domain-containing protein n=1 Tax=Candidatus Termititenax persephonae TaxID=2218525 RepID=A0A388TGG8_9BACT|nr:Por secretion system C-terminal sorting domain-containing protein [Candidatus Termititenax persephonae]
MAFNITNNLNNRGIRSNVWAWDNPVLTQKISTKLRNIQIQPPSRRVFASDAQPDHRFALATVRSPEEEVKEKEEDVRIKAEEEARVKAEEEARIKAEEETRVKAEEEIRAKAKEVEPKKLSLTVSGGGYIREAEQSAHLHTTIMPLTIKPNIPGVSTIRIGGGINFNFHRTTERLTHRYLKPPPPNAAPTASAGVDQTITLPTDTATLDGSASSDSDGSISGYLWTQVSKPSGAPDATLSNANAANATVGGLQQGTYVFRLKVTDNDGAEATDDITVTVNAAPPPPPPPNTAPTANAGTDQTITLPTDTATLDGSASSDSDGSIASYEWTQTAGPVTATISSSGNSSTGVGGLTTAGTYTFQLKVTDNEGAESVDTVTINVYAANIPPTANAGNDQNIKLPVSSVTLSGNASSDSDGSIASYEWTQTAGPVTATISSSGNSSTGVGGLTTAGTYTFQLKVTDNEGAESTDTVTINVYAANIPPTAVAGTDQTITLPTDTATLDGSASSDSDGNISGYLWTQVSKPSGAPDATLSNANAATATVGGLQQGAYVFRLKVTDNDGAEATNDITVTVAPQPMITVTKNIAIEFLLLGSGNGHYVLDFTPTITPDSSWDVNFPSDCVTYALDNSPNASDYTIGDKVTITETFYYAGNIIATLVITANVEDDWGGGRFFNNVTATSTPTNPIRLEKEIPLPPPLPSIAVWPSSADALNPLNTPLADSLEDALLDTANYPLAASDFSAEPLRYIDDPNNPYALVEYFKNTSRFRILPHFDLEIIGQKFKTPLGNLTPFLQERFEIGVEFTAVDVEVAAAAPEAAVKEIEDLAAQDNAVSFILANELKIFSTLDLLAIPGHITLGLELKNSSYADDRYSGSLKYLHDINYRALQSASGKITAGFTQTGINFWRSDILANLLPAPETKISRLTTGLNLYGENNTFGIGTTVIWRPLAFMEYGFNLVFQDVRRLNSLSGVLAAKFYF